MTDPSVPGAPDPSDQATYAFDGALVPPALRTRYDVLDCLGAGGMGVVYKARDRETGATVALKVIHPAVGGQPGVADRFKTELLLARQITHKNVCRVYDLNRFDALLVIAMEYIEGERLRDLMKRTGRLPLEDAVRIVGQVISGLREAHVQGIVHRDLKPENVMLARDGTARLMDFGLARSTESDGTTGAILGTPAYMAPEQAEGRTVDPRTDIYALGLILYELLTGRATFSGETPVVVALKQIRETPVPPGEVEPTISRAVEKVILRCLEKDPSARFQTVDELEDALKTAASGAHPTAALPPPPAKRGSRGMKMAVAAALVIGVGGAIALWTWSGPSSIAISFRKFTLDNGLRVILSEDHSAPTFSIGVLYNVGSRDERPGKTGYAHLFEHMMFDGSLNVGKGEHSLLVAGNGGSANGTTNADTTMYYQTLPATQLDLALFLEADRMKSLVINERNLETAKATVIQERVFQYENQPYGRTALAIAETAFDNFGYKHPTIGSAEDVRAATVDDLKAFFGSYYAPNNAVLSIVGDVQPDDALAKIRKYFGAIAARPPPPAPDMSEPAPSGERRLMVEDPFAQAPRLDIFYKTVPTATPDWYAVRVVLGILGSGQSSRLYQKLVRETEVAVSVFSTVQTRRGSSLDGFVAVPRPGKDPKQIEQLLYEEIGRLATGPISDVELDRFRLQVRRELVRQSSGTLNRALGLAQDEAFHGDPGMINTVSRTLERLSASDLQRVARTYLTEARRTVVLTVPLSRPAASVASASAPPDKSEPLSAVERKGRAPVSNDVLRAKLPTAVETVLDNGLTVIVLEDHRFPIVTLQVGISGAGSLYDPPDLPGLASVTAQMLRLGTKTRSSRQVAEDVENLGAGLSVTSAFGSSATTVSASGLSDNFDAWFELFADVLLRPVFPVDELNGLRQRTKTQLRQSRATPGFLATERLAGALYGDHPARIQSTTPTALDAMTSEILTRHYSETYVPQNAILTIAGDVRASLVIRTAQNRFGQWRKTDRKEAIPPHPTRVQATRILLVDRPNSPQTSFVLGNVAIDRRDPDYIPLLVMNQLVGGDRARLFLKLREERGYTYGAGSTFTAFKYPGPWRMTTDVRATATEDALGLMLQEARRIRDERAPQEELENAKRSLASRFAISLEDPAQLVTYLNVRKIYGFSADYWDTYPARIMAVSADEVQRVAQKYVDPDAMVIVAVGDRRRIEPALIKFGPVELFDGEGRPEGTSTRSPR